MTATATPLRIGGATANKPPAASPPRHNVRNFGYFDLEDQLGVTGWGVTVEQAFEELAQGVFAVMARNTNDTSPDRLTIIDFEESDLKRALVTWVDRALQVAQTDGLDLMRFKLRRIGHHWYAEGWGVPCRDTATHRRRVKAADPSFVKVALVDGVWEARCLVDW